MKFKTVLLTMVALMIMPLVLAASASDIHAEQNVTALQVAMSGLAQVQTWVASDKLEKNWLTGLSGLTVSKRNIKGFAEYVVRVTRAEGKPAAVEIYFNFDGQYSGSSIEK